MTTVQMQRCGTARYHDGHAEDYSAQVMMSNLYDGVNDVPAELLPTNVVNPARVVDPELVESSRDKVGIEYDHLDGAWEDIGIQ